MTMKTTGIKSWFCDVLALPIIAAILLVKYMETALLMALSFVDIQAFRRAVDRFSLWGPRAATLDGESAKPEPPSVAGLDHAAAFLAELEAGDDDGVAGARGLLERTKLGKEVVDLMPGRHDYIVAVPTKSENLRRIANVLAAMPDRVRAGMIDVVRNNRCHWMFRDNQES